MKVTIFCVLINSEENILMLRTKVIFYDYYLLNTSKQVISLIKQYIGKTKEFNCIFNKIAV